MKLLIALLFTFSSLCLADLGAQASGSVVAGSGTDMEDGYEYKFAASYDEWSLWVSTGEQSQVMTTQSPGELGVTAIGVGYEHPITNRLIATVNFGYADINEDYSARVSREAMYFFFVPTYGHPTHIMPVGAYMNPEIVFVSEIDPAPIFRIGVSYLVTDHITIDLGYRFLRPTQFIRFYNSNLGFDPSDPSACDCAWEGKQIIDMSAWTVGASVRF